jgi:hypothetical protein
LGQWDIHPEAVRGVLQHTQGVASEFEDHLTAMQSAMQDAASQASSEIIGQALLGLAEARGADMRFVSSRIEAALGGAATAVNAYLQGDHEMVLHAQTGAASAPDPRAHMPGGQQ